MDPVYNTPVFKLVGGQTSCPHEEGTAQLDNIDLSLDTFFQSNLPENATAIFELGLRNAYLTSNPAFRTFTVDLVNESNAQKGALVSLDGASLNNGTVDLSVNSNSELLSNLEIQKGISPTWDYKDLQVIAYPACGSNFAKIDGIVDTVTFTALFQSTCSSIEFDMANMQDNWIVNQNDGNRLQIFLKDFIPNNLEEVEFQFRPVGGANGSVAKTFSQADLQGLFIPHAFFWDMSLLPDNDYEIRAKTKCSDGAYNYSSILRGKLDRGYLLLLGAPEPADGVRNLGDQISATFDEILVSEFIDKKVMMQIDGENTLVELQPVSVFENTLFISPIPSEWACGAWP